MSDLQDPNNTATDAQKPNIEKPNEEATNANDQLMEIKRRLEQFNEEAKKLDQSITSSNEEGEKTEQQVDSAEIDNRSIYVGNLEYSTSAENLSEIFEKCGNIIRITIPCHRFTNHPKGFAYIEFGDEESVENAEKLNGTLNRGRQLAVKRKRKNVPGMSTTFRGRGRGRGRGNYRGGFNGHAPYGMPFMDDQSGAPMPGQMYPQVPPYGGYQRGRGVARRSARLTFFNDVLEIIHCRCGKVELEYQVLLENVQVVDVINPASKYPRLQIGAGNKREKTTTKPLLGHFKRNGVSPKMRVAEFMVSSDAVLSPGTTLNAAHFVPGQLVDLTAPSIGKGFAGAMKRWGFAGGRASHGASLSHRSAGSTGQNQDPGRVFPGKKMAGRMGGKSSTKLCAKVMKVDTRINCIWVKGPVPGFDGQFIRVRDSIKPNKPLIFPKDCTPPFPTYIPEKDATVPQEMVAKSGTRDPFVPTTD
ncbi:hypothetical protein H4219_005078 [Mycoemilia scoparia]|uniref:Large ribosomal subunit protein uL3m n=1 Tax=Mycoemilia scoparia TaxID=417184 RepID=A0A9W7ZQE2_9FUNG|nr:hypothetical protein H4219_005078 [Mycoemilia scoparia]